MKVRVLYNSDGGVSVVWPVLKSRRPNETEEGWLSRVFAKANPGGLPCDDMDSDNLPDKRFRSAWVKGDVGSGVEVDIAKAKAQVMAELRKARDDELARTDGLMARASEIGSQVEGDELRGYRQKLRDLPLLIEIGKIQTVDALTTAYPFVLTIDKYLDLASS